VKKKNGFSSHSLNNRENPELPYAQIHIHSMTNWKELLRAINDEKAPLNKIRRLFSKRIDFLCIEDNPHISFLLCDEYFRSSMLNKKSVHTFNQAKQAILSKVHFHCWILDLTLDRPNDGLELLELKPNFPYCIVVSGAQSMDSASQAMTRGAFWAYDKRNITSDPNIFIFKTCRLMALSFLLKARHSKWHDMFTLLLDEFVQTPEQWSEKIHRHQQTIRTVCEEMTGLNAKQFLCLFHALYGALSVDCLIDPIDGHDDIHKSFISNWDFHTDCAQYVISHLSAIYTPMYLDK
jgi:hypothetical protein